MPPAPGTENIDSPLKEPYAVTPILSDDKAVLRKLIYVFLLATFFMAVEIVGGIISGSISILSDAAHMLSDILGFIISIISVLISRLPADKKHSYGYHRAGVIGALASIMVIWALTGFFIYFAIIRVMNLEEVEVHGKIMFGVACFGLVCNFIMMKVLHGDVSLHSHDHSGHSHSHGLEHNHNHEHTHDHEHEHEHEHDEKEHDHDHHDHDEKEHCKDDEEDETSKLLTKPEEQNKSSHVTEAKKKLSKIAESDNLNVRATIVHVLGDILQSVGVIIASILIWIDPVHLKIADPIVTFIFAVIVFFTTFKVAKDCILILMEDAPKGLDVEKLEGELKHIEGVVLVEDLHVWSLGAGKVAMAAHLEIKGEPGLTLKKATKICRKYEIYHSTIQIETEEDKNHPEYLAHIHNIH